MKLKVFTVILVGLLAVWLICQNLFNWTMVKKIDELEQRLDLQRVCIEALEDNVQTLNDTLGIDW